MARRKQTSRTTVKDVRAILRLRHARSLSVREVSDRLKVSNSTVSTYPFRAGEAGFAGWPLPAGYAEDAVFERAPVRRTGRRPSDSRERDRVAWPSSIASSGPCSRTSMTGRCAILARIRLEIFEAIERCRSLPVPQPWQADSGDPPVHSPLTTVREC